jgi:hypothetical protein
LRVFENRVLRTIATPSREEVAGGLIKLYDEEFCNMYISTSVIRAFSSRRLRGTGHIVHMREVRTAYKV